MELLKEALRWVSGMGMDLPKEVAHLMVDRVLAIPLSLLVIVYRRMFGEARQFSPGLGLANGYYNNFLGPLLRANNGPSEVRLWMSPPKDLNHDREQYEHIINGRYPNLTYKECQVRTEQGIRSILIDQPAHAKDFKYPALDFPRTLSDFDDFAPARRLQTLGGNDAFQRREMENFWKTLSVLVRKGFHATRVKVFCGKPENAEREAYGIVDYSKMLDKTCPKRFFARMFGF